VDLENQSLRQVLDWNTMDIDWQGRGLDRGLRGIAIHEDTVFIAASDELFAYRPDFSPIGSWRNPYLKHCHEIAVWEGNVFLSSTGYDSILAFDIRKQQFHWALQVDMEQFRFKGVVYDPNGGDGPLMLNKLHLNNVVPCQGGMYISGTRTGGMLHFNGEHVRMAVTLSNAAGTPVWQGITEGSASRFGRSYKAENYYEALSDSLIEATTSLMRNPGFHAALAKP